MKRNFKIISVLIIALVLMPVFAVPALADNYGVEFNATLAQTRRLIYAGEAVDFKIHVDNTGTVDLIGFEVAYIDGGPWTSYEGVSAGGSKDLTVTHVFDEAGDYAVRFKVVGKCSSNPLDDVMDVTNIVDVTVSEPPPTPTPEPTEEPTPSPTLEPTEQPTEEPAEEPVEEAAGDPEPSEEPEDEPEPTQTTEETDEPVAIAMTDIGEDTGQPPEEKSEAAGAEAKDKGSSDTVLYVIIGVMGAIIVGGAAAMIIILKKKKGRTQA